uniref:High-affinity nitrate transporter n=1 Tax=Tetradesmus obliquus TaxID=3088 RepID=A0A383VNL4_TETOB|eukprot:jgi/Sobl393_1/10188/SZX66324.1
MARCLSLAVALVALVGYAAATGNIEDQQPTSYTQLAPVKGQWDITLKATKTADKAAFEPVDCAEPKISAACNKPLLTADAKDKLQVTAALKGKTLKTIDDLTPKRVVIKACYSKPSATDRPWRKSNDVIDKDKSCPFVIKSTELNVSSTSYSIDWPIPKNMTKAAWYATVLVLCENGTLNSYCQFDNTVNKTYFGTNIINSTPTSMIIATAVCASIGPLFLASYFIKDFMGRKKQ